MSDDKFKEDGARRQDVDRQLEKLRGYSKAMQWGEPELFIDDGKSAFKDDYNSRPAFSRLMREIRARRVQRVIVEDLTRWSRRLDDGLRTLKEASDYGCTVSSMLEGEADVTTANGWMRSALSLMFAEWSSRVQSEKVKSGMARVTDVCPSCKVVHLGRHPGACECEKCLKRKGRSKNKVPREAERPGKRQPRKANLSTEARA